MQLPRGSRRPRTDTKGKSMKHKAQRKAGRKNRNRPVRRKIAFREKAPTTARQYFSKSRKFQETWDSVAHVISKMRSGRTSLRKAAREFGIEPNQVIRLGRSALKKQKNGRYAAKKTDRVLRMLGVLTVDGKREIAVRDSRQASVIGSHWDAVQRYLQTGMTRHCGSSTVKRSLTQAENVIYCSQTSMN
jgi:hypothetical protein